MATQGGQGDAADILTVYEYPASLRILQPGHEVEQGRFSRAGPSHNRRDLPRGKGVAEIINDLWAIGCVGKVEIFNRQTPGHGGVAAQPRNQGGQHLNIIFLQELPYHGENGAKDEPSSSR